MKLKLTLFILCLIPLYVFGQNVGVGQTAPTNTLHVTPSGGQDPVRIDGLQLYGMADTSILMVNPTTGLVKYILPADLVRVLGLDFVAGPGITIVGNTITNTASDVPVVLTGVGSVSITGTYPNFTISATDNVNDADSDPANEYNTGATLTGTMLGITDAGGTQMVDLSSLQDGVNDADSDPANELNTGATLTGTMLGITDAGGTQTVDLSSLQDGVNDADSDPANELNTGATLTGTNLNIIDAGGTQTVNLAALQDGVNDADSDPANEFNTGATLTGTNLNIIDNGGTQTVNLAALQDGVNDADSDPSNEFNTGATLSGTSLNIIDGGGTQTVNLAALQDGVNDADSDPANEFNTGATLTGTNLNIIDNGGTQTVNLAALQDGVNDADSDPSNEFNTGATLSGTSLNIIDGGGTQTVNLAALQDGVNDADSDPANEFNTNVTLTGTTLNVIDGGGAESVNLASLVNDADSNPSNELNSNVTLTGTTLNVIDAGGTQSVNLASLQDGVNDADSNPANEFNTNVTLTGTTLNVIDGGGTQSVNLASLVGDADWTVSGANQYSAVSGNVGIGIAAPQYKLDVVSGSQSVTSKFLKSGNEPRAYLAISNDNTGAFDGITGFNINGHDIGVLGVSVHPGSNPDNYGIYGYSSGWGGTFENSLSGDFVELSGASIYPMRVFDASATITPGMVLTAMDANGNTQWQTPGGDIGGITAGAGLTGGGTSGTPTINANANNGLNVDAGADRIQLGGPLTETTTLTFGAYSLIHNLNSIGDFLIRDNGVNRFAVLDNGRTTVGSTASAGMFNVTGNSFHSDDIYLRDGSVTGVNLVRIFDSSDDGLIDVYRAGSVVNRLHGNGNNFINGGFLGLGTTAPQERLHTIGTQLTETNGAGATDEWYGEDKVMTTSSTDLHNGTGDRNTFTGNGNRTYFGVSNWHQGTGTGTKYGVYNLFEDVPGIKYGMYSTVTGTGTGTYYGTYNYSSNTSTSTKYGVRNQIINPGSTAYGTYNYITPLSTSTSGTKYGTYNLIGSNGGGTRYGTYNSVSSSTTSTYNTYGVYCTMGSSGTGNKYAAYFNSAGVNGHAAVFNSGQVIANEIGGDYDFRIESDTRTHAFWLDANENLVNFGSPFSNASSNGATVTGVVVDYVADFDKGTATGTGIGIGSIEFLLDGNAETTINNTFSPTTHLIRDLGFSTLRAWDDVFADDFVNVSDRREKNNIENLSYGLTEIMAMRPVSYKLNRDEHAETKLGLIAQEVLPIVKEAVKTHDFRILDESTMVEEEVEMERMGMKYQQLIPVLIKATQEQQDMIEELKKTNEAQQSLIEELNKRLMMQENSNPVEANQLAPNTGGGK